MLGSRRLSSQKQLPIAWDASTTGSSECFTSDNPATQRVLSLAARVARFDTNILIVGESGVGKERLARFIHERSARTHGPFVAVNCGALPDALFEAELFGHTRGAFTGAVQDRPGMFEAAANGTLLLDEVGEVPHHLQVKLLRALQEGEVRRLGENRQRKTDARIIAATNRRLAHDVEEGRFRRDLFYRLSVVVLEIPPLRERPEDLLTLSESILRSVATRIRRPITGYTPEALDRLRRYHWPGNVRELENAIEHACAIAAEDVIQLHDLPDELRHHRSLNTDAAYVRPLHEVEREYILAALQRNQGNRTRTAQQLKIGAATLFRKLKQYAVTA